MTNQNPYQNLPGEAYWRTGVASCNPLDFEKLYTRKFEILETDKIATAGSCFAQHIGRHMAKSGFNYRDYEKAPPLLPQHLHAKYGYGIYSARYGNIYTAHQLSQLFDRAYGKFTPEETVWTDGERYIDPFRPTIEPNGFSCLEEFKILQDAHFSAVRKMFETADVFVFTLGLTEAWRHTSDKAVYPVCPGTAAGTFDADVYEFHNFTFVEIYQELKQTLAKMREINPGLKVILTVSPVPLTATASDKHVLVASMHSKSTLRTVAGELAQEDPLTDYFPSYEIVASHPMRAMFFDPNLRTVSLRGVDQVMRHFFKEHTPPGVLEKSPAGNESLDEDDIVCDEELLEMEQTL
ncbi:hypothetical protein GCM10017044_17820 [Kordiimonas sediminis]|uniref:GSCFA domain-containing protein n=1 Tax=Kordiimonas sediminis TaxID=1735581 RepID=A0A919ARK0_9PROT|nr:GSCFA domain-containing protein [Kordiimonas sediminis]GHF23685.1 hypothetical protein GCM10017044_17820 [Kordiimonas sediminis]